MYEMYETGKKKNKYVWTEWNDDVYNTGPDSPPQVLGDEKTELTPG
jgi:hypothetical protein